MNSSAKSSDESVAVFGGGCFWCIEAVFQQLEGVTKVEPGYSGGDKENPTYQDVSSGTTGHAEVVRIFFNPEVISYRELLEVFFTVHDPTTLNRQGADVGPQYRSVIFYQDDKQKAEAKEMIRWLEENRIFDDPVVTEIAQAGPFYVAEDYHHDYYQKNRNQTYCQVVINPKLKKLREKFSDKLR
ncbi:MAG: peptide-methionine (S)-S-oxide reductase MsrA [Marinilabiliaceae bacterium]